MKKTSDVAILLLRPIYAGVTETSRWSGRQSPDKRMVLTKKQVYSLSDIPSLIYLHSLVELVYSGRITKLS